MISRREDWVSKKIRERLTYGSKRTDLSNGTQRIHESAEILWFKVPSGGESWFRGIVLHIITVQTSCKIHKRAVTWARMPERYWLDTGTEINEWVVNREIRVKHNIMLSDSVSALLTVWITVYKHCEGVMRMTSCLERRETSFNSMTTINRMQRWHRFLLDEGVHQQ